VEAFTDSLAREMEDLDVFVAAVEPGNFASEIGLTRRKRRLADTDAKPYVNFRNVVSDCSPVARKDSKPESKMKAPLRMPLLLLSSMPCLTKDRKNITWSCLNREKLAGRSGR
jgi:hypothetical protein